MAEYLAVLDWIIIALYLIGLLALAVFLSKTQADRKDYYLGGKHIGAWPIAISIMATQCSTNSILGAPAFVGFAEGGGLVWLQYELAVPLAMVILIIAFVPYLSRFTSVSIYSFLEQRFDLQMRLLLSGLFLFVRAFATSVTVYSIAIVVDLITGIGFFWSVVILGAFTVIYDTLGGMRGVVYSDVLQMGLLVSVLILLLFLLIGEVGGVGNLFNSAPADRVNALDFSHHGFGDGQTFAFWPMLMGGLFLYVAYYGCDQSQAQRLLSARDNKQTQLSLFLNGLLRFPIVAIYCFVGLALAVYAQQNPSFTDALPIAEGTPQYNLVVPLYMMQSLPVGLVGLSLVALFAAAMSSLDSVINSLSATTMDDFVRRFKKSPMSLPQELAYSRWITVFWGTVTLALAFFVGDIAPTVLEAINKIGSLANGPILAVFLCGFWLTRVTADGMKVGFVVGLISNILFWLFWKELSWLWWNVTGCIISIAVALVFSLSKKLDTNQVLSMSPSSYSLKLVWGLVFWFGAMLCMLIGLRFA